MYILKNYSLSAGFAQCQRGLFPIVKEVYIGNPVPCWHVIMFFWHLGCGSRRSIVLRIENHDTCVHVCIVCIYSTNMHIDTYMYMLQMRKVPEEGP